MSRKWRRDKAVEFEVLERWYRITQSGKAEVIAGQLTNGKFYYNVGRQPDGSYRVMLENATSIEEVMAMADVAWAMRGQLS